MITSASNTQVKNIMQLMKKAKARKDQGLFVVEGKRMFTEVPPEALCQIYVSESFLTQEDSKHLIAHQTYEVLSDDVFQKISDTRTPQGILCLVKTPEFSLEEILAKEPAHLLILESIQDPGNLGTIFRSGEGAGVTGILMNRTTVDVFNPKTIRSTMGSIYRVPFVIAEDLGAAIRQLKEQGVTLYAAHLRGSMQYDEPDYKKASGFIIGNEGNGLSDETGALADEYIRIPMEGKVESLNAAIAATLLMYEVNRQRRR